MPTHYDVLGVRKDTSLEEIKRAHKKLSLEYHPDLTGGVTEEKMKLINQAYQVLSVPADREIYNTKIKERSKK